MSDHGTPRFFSMVNNYISVGERQLLLVLVSHTAGITQVIRSLDCILKGRRRKMRSDAPSLSTLLLLPLV